jgi:hypothetical protein
MFSTVIAWLGSSAVGQIVVKSMDGVMSLFKAKNTDAMQSNAQAQDMSKEHQEHEQLVSKTNKEDNLENLRKEAGE